MNLWDISDDKIVKDTNNDYCNSCLNDGKLIIEKYLEKKYPISPIDLIGTATIDSCEKRYILALNEDKDRIKLVLMAKSFSTNSILYNLPQTIIDRLLREIGLQDIVERTELYRCLDCNQYVCLKCLNTTEDEIIKGEEIMCQSCFEEKIVIKKGKCEECGDNMKVNSEVETELYKCEDCNDFKCRDCLWDDGWEERLEDGIFMCYECYKINSRISEMYAYG